MKHILKRSISQIYRAIIRYNHANLSLIILEYCPAEELLQREKHYLDLLCPEYNIYLDPSALKIILLISYLQHITSVRIPVLLLVGK
jgi:hypothetical protein